MSIRQECISASEIFGNYILGTVYVVSKKYNLDILEQYIHFKSLLELSNDNVTGSEKFDLVFNEYLDKFTQPDLKINDQCLF